MKIKETSAKQHDYSHFTFGNLGEYRVMQTFQYISIFIYQKLWYILFTVYKVNNIS